MTVQISSEEERPERRRGASRSRRRFLAAGIVTALAAAGTTLAAQRWPSDDQDAATHNRPRSTAPVERTSLASGLQLDGELGHTPADEITAQGQGTFTKLPKNGDHIRVGEPLYEIDAQPVVLFRGSRPFWRVLQKGMSDGPDVKDLERNLTELGFADATNLTVDEEFTDATTEAVKRWQKALGVEQTGTVELGRVAVLPYGDVWVEEVVAKPGATAGTGGTVLKVTTTDVYATIKPEEEQLPQLPPGSRLMVRLDVGGTLQGRITSITRNTPGSGDGSGGPDNQAKPTVSIRLKDQKKATAALRSGRVGVTVTVPEKKADDVLAVPVTALLATAGGGYGVEVVRPDSAEPELVPVKVGLIVAGQAEVEGRIKEGDKVVIPV
ncbi:peptidoglycan-binding protein [Streptomyces sp. NBRC 14336]|uniref:peptidoglycan-binding protein n=1 Tax=unclassified Streptomyces TaxID=2593676 RepID=UPI0007F42DC7|nr:MULTISPECIES: peptidoglycan-binding protein [unclassified Streptomyces]MCM1976558.1 peptidoglycan-binding protein [Streptomyces sp. G1]GLW49452.1 peptidoglycan-binding protein [Streptomyces sp. NBRC 14336]SBT89019.1 Multidrug efflux pump subunit AcrA (membrane-fusion protein) [Streptomyces sp. DI166]